MVAFCTPLQSVLRDFFGIPFCAVASARLSGICLSLSVEGSSPSPPGAELILGAAFYSPSPSAAVILLLLRSPLFGQEFPWQP